MSLLENEFRGFVGLTIKNPDRLTCDVDLVVDKIRGVAARNGLILNFQKAAIPAGAFPPKVVTGHIAPENFHKSRWRITEFTFT